MRSTRAILLLTLLVLGPLCSMAEQPPAGWVPQGIEALGSRAAFHTDFTFDRSMLQLASNFMDDEDTRRAVAKLQAISVHSYRFAAPGMYNPAALDGIRAQYSATGWKHLVTAHAKGDPFTAGQTDLWISFAHMDVTGMVVMFSDPKNLNLIAVTGDLSPLDLLHLRGHFGIPKFDADGLQSGPQPSPGSTQPMNPPTEETQPAPPPPAPPSQ